MNKSVLMSIQPYWVFLIIARTMGWNITQDKTVEVRKDFPKDPAWNKVTHIYFSKSKKSFNRIPNQYQPLMAKFLGKVIGEFVCDDIDSIAVFGRNLYCVNNTQANKLSQMCLTIDEVIDYLGEKNCGFNWHISNLKIYDAPKELDEFKKAGYMTEEQWLYALYPNTHCHYAAWVKKFEITRPPQSWCYVEELGE